MPVSDTQPGWQSEKANHKTIPSSKKQVFRLFSTNLDFHKSWMFFFD